ncbi:MAG: FAD binding domain-containing protein [Pseudomonadota bacterium]
MISYDYMKPASLDEAISLLSIHGPGATLIAGGTDVLVNMRNRKITPKVLVSIRGIKELQYIRKDNDYHIGAMTPHAMLDHSPLVRSELAALQQGASQVGSVQLRNVATIGGNICNAAPSADTAAPLLVFDAVAVLKSAEGNREIAVRNLFKGPSVCDLHPGEILVELKIPGKMAGYGSYYHKHVRRKALNLPIIGVAVAIKLTAENIIEDAKIGLTVVAPTPIRADIAENYLKGKPFTDDVLAEAGRLASSPECCSPRDSLRCEGWYREDMVRVLIPRAAKKAADQIRKRGEKNT